MIRHPLVHLLLRNRRRRMRSDKEDEDDEFWRIALHEHDAVDVGDGDSDSGSAAAVAPSRRQEEVPGAGGTAALDDETSAAAVTAAPSTAYRIRLPDSRERVALRLSPLSMNDGPFSPLGAQAWYGSALLASLLAMCSSSSSNEPPVSPFSRLRRQISSLKESKNDVKALELGSGAVGLAGMVLGLVLADHLDTATSTCDSIGDSPDVEVILTDNEPLVLKQLEANVRSNVRTVRTQHPRLQLPQFSVRRLNWDDGICEDDGNGSVFPPPVQLVVGSELVYTTSTAKACAKIVTQLLERNPREAFVVLVQTTDRDGWEDAFLPEIRAHPDLVAEVDVVDADLHVAASTLIKRGGTLDGFDFGTCCIYHRSNRYQN